MDLGVYGCRRKQLQDTHLDSSQIILLLVSANFIASDYCWDVEVKRAMERHESKEARVIPTILDFVDWQSAPFGKLQALPEGGRAVKKWGSRDAAFLSVALRLSQFAIANTRN
ncbi:toll/interleukin-1 receptor domain-containing protein [Nostoc favosum]|uniref:Toll/interleukin-1 receptor domain-containing protein n=1 Tax=Nostoc favosum CHAB5714 TaxID=2780399 RepID=A0ABS8I8F2_9NOSO|nr:toll/interleukin-1 receptor domain-containing protein [Nostoc favosum]MCC5599999.1 toll/interleukin-1 receptor domain-containing protein [Nostoc favosum CHAB5714]